MHISKRLLEQHYLRLVKLFQKLHPAQLKLTLIKKLMRMSKRGVENKQQQIYQRNRKRRGERETLLKISYLKSQQKILREIKMFLIEKQAIHNHTHTQQIEILENYIASN